MTDERAPMLSASTMLEELRHRVNTTADALLADGDESGATDLYEVERSLRQAARRLNRYLAARA